MQIGRRQMSFLLLSVGLALAIAYPAEPADYDLAILNGRVIDPETNLDRVANVGIEGGRIAIITDKSISGDRSVDAAGHVVAPGFIDLHAH